MFFNWRINALECCVGSCRTTIQFSCNRVCIRMYLLYVSPTSGASLTHYSTPLGHRRAPGWVPCAMQQLAILHMVVYIWQCYFLNLIHTLLPSCVYYVHSLRLRLYSCPANRSISTIFLDSTYMH